MTCPNSTESGCRCTEHHPGLGYRAPTEHRPAPAVVHLVTTGTTRTSTDELVDRLVKPARDGCDACAGDASRCLQGTGHPHFRRLTGCAAYDDGELRPLRAPEQPRQPWEPRPARAA